MSHICLIAARARNGVIGAHNTLPWRLPEDLKYFRTRTLGHPIVMGRKTWDSLGRALPGRRNLVVSRQVGWATAGAETFASLEAAIAACGEEDVFVIGGAQLYAAALPIATRLYLTEIDADFEGDAFFPDFDRAQWREVARELGVSDTGLRYAFVTLERAAR